VIRDDARGRRVAIVPDFVVNPGSGLYEGRDERPGPVLDVLIEDGWGIMKAPPHILSKESAARAVSVMVGDAVDYLRHDYTVMIVGLSGLPQNGVWLDLLEAAFRELATPMPNVVRFNLAPPGSPPDAAGIRSMLNAPGARNDAVPESRCH
jgi:hypothetical protein